MADSPLASPDATNCVVARYGVPQAWELHNSLYCVLESGNSTTEDCDQYRSLAFGAGFEVCWILLQPQDRTLSVSHEIFQGWVVLLPLAQKIPL